MIILAVHARRLVLGIGGQMRVGFAQVLTISPSKISVGGVWTYIFHDVFNIAGQASRCSRGSLCALLSEHPSDPSRPGVRTAMPHLSAATPSSRRLDVAAIIVAPLPQALLSTDVCGRGGDGSPRTLQLPGGDAGPRAVGFRRSPQPKACWQLSTGIVTWNFPHLEICSQAFSSFCGHSDSL